MKIQFSPGAFRHLSVKDLGLRFFLGGIVAVVAGLVTLTFNDQAGGLFLAFPIILPATLTFLAKRDGREASLSDLDGAEFGAVGLLAFAVVVLLTIQHIPAIVTLGVALLAWTVVAVLLYRALHDRRPWARDQH